MPKVTFPARLFPAGHALAESGGSRSIVQQHHFVVRQSCVLYILAGEALRIYNGAFYHGFSEISVSFPRRVKGMKIAQRKYASYSGQLFFFQIFPDGIAGKQWKTDSNDWRWWTSLGVKSCRMGTMMPVGDGCHIGDAMSVVFADHRNLVASAQTANVWILNAAGLFFLFGHFAIRILCTFTVVGVTGQIPIFTKTASRIVW